MRLDTVAQYKCGPQTRVYAEGWQSWSPATWFDGSLTPILPAGQTQHLMRYRPDREVPHEGVHAEGLVAVDPGNGAPIQVFAATTPTTSVPRIQVRRCSEGLEVLAEDGVALQEIAEGAGTEKADSTNGPSWSRAEAALRSWARSAKISGALPTVPSGPWPWGVHAPRVWCTWYQYFEAVTATDIVENIAAMDRHQLDIDVVQIDDGWARGAGEGFSSRPEFGDVRTVVDAIHDSGRHPGIWLAPFIAGVNSTLVRKHPEAVVGAAGENWGSSQVGLDPAHSVVLDLVTSKVAQLAELGVRYFKLDFLYAALLHTGPTEIAAYRAALQAIRDAAGPDSYLLGCGAPIWPSLGLVEAMRVSPDVFHEDEQDGQATLRSRLSVDGRRWQNGMLWAADPDCLVLRPAFRRREEWTSLVLDYGGLVSWSDRITDLDDWGLATAQRAFQKSVRPTAQFVSES